jgi:hypothetical protein
MSSKFVLARITILCQDTALMAKGKALTLTEFARMGGKARAQKLSKDERQESARRAAQARWAKKKGAKQK